MDPSAHPLLLPDPAEAGSWDALTELLRELHRICGRPTYDALSARTGLPKSAISYLVGRNPVRQPSESTVDRFVRGCLGYAGLDPAAVRAEADRWRTARAQLAADVDVAPVTPELPPAPTPAPGPRYRRRVLAVGAVALTLAGAGVAGGIAHSQVGQRSSAGPVPGVTSGVPSPSDPSISPSPVTTPAVGAPSGPTCVARAEPQTDTRLGRTWDKVFYCPNRPALVYTWAVDDGKPIADLESRSSWFVCWTTGRSRSGGPAVFYYTQGDTTFRRPELASWGFVPAASVAGDRAPAAGVSRRCDFPVSGATR